TSSLESQGQSYLLSGPQYRRRKGFDGTVPRRPASTRHDRGSGYDAHRRGRHPETRTIWPALDERASPSNPPRRRRPPPLAARRVTARSQRRRGRQRVERVLPAEDRDGPARRLLADLRQPRLRTRDDDDLT